MPLVPQHRLVICSHLLCFVAVFCSPSWSCPLLDHFCFRPCFPCPLFVFLVLFLGSSLVLTLLFRFSLFVFRPVVLRLSSLRPLCASSGVAGFPFLLFLLCCVVAPLPRWLSDLAPGVFLCFFSSSLADVALKARSLYEREHTKKFV